MQEASREGGTARVSGNILLVICEEADSENVFLSEVCSESEAISSWTNFPSILHSNLLYEMAIT